MILVLLPLIGACNPETVTVSEDHEEDRHDLPLDVVELTPESIETAQIQIEESKEMDLRIYLETTGVVSADETRLAHIRPLHAELSRRSTFAVEIESGKGKSWWITTTSSWESLSVKL